MIAGDPTARLRMATLLHTATGWDIFPELHDRDAVATLPGRCRDAVSRLWAQDWDSPEDSVDDDTDDDR